MIPKLDDVLNLLETMAPSRLAETWDNPGLQVASAVRRIEKIYVALDPTLDAVRSASKGRAQLLLTHHPLLFKPLSSLHVDSYPGNVISEALSVGMSVVSLHTNLDAAQGGINDILAGLLNLRGVQVLVPVARDEGEAGLGRVGDLPEPAPLSEVISRVKGILGTNHLRVVGEGERRIVRVAVMGGSGGGMISQAVERGADLLLTGDVGHHHALEALSRGLSLIDGGHFLTERAALAVFSDRLRDTLREKGWETLVEFGEDEGDPARFT